MASTRLLVEGPDIEDLLARVREEHGPGVRIVQADKLRTGGVGGFFARERFAVTIEVQDPRETEAEQPAASPTPAAVAAPGSLLDIADAIDVAEAAGASVAMSTAGMSKPRTVGQAPPHQAAARPAVSPALRPLSTERPDFAKVLAGLATTIRSNADTAPPEEDVGFVVADIAKKAVPAELAAAVAAPASQALTAARPVTVETLAPAPEAPVTVETLAPAPEAPVTVETQAPAPEAPASPVAPAPSVNVVADPVPPAPVNDAAASASGDAVAVSEPAGDHPAEADVMTNPLVQQLLALGLPAEMAAQLDGVDVGNLRERLVGVLSNRPLAPAVDVQEGDVLVIAGMGVAAYDTACAVSRRLRLDPVDVLLAAPSDLGLPIPAGSRISGPADARRRSGALRRADLPTVVAVDAPCDGESVRWARDIADGLGARVTWAVVDASVKPADLIDHLKALGRVDGLVVRGTAASRDPGTVLQAAVALRLPTVLLDGRPGDAEAWATLLIDRMGYLS